MRRFPHGGEVLGASPAHPLLAPVLRPEMVLSRQQALLDLQSIQRIPGLAGYWSADPAYLFEDSGATTPATLHGVVGCWTSVGPAAIQATTAVKPYLRQTPTSNVYWIDSNTSTSALTATLGNLGESCTVATAGPDGPQFKENVSITSTYNIAKFYEFNADIAIFNRALTASEKALIARYMSRQNTLYGSLQNAIPQMRGAIANTETATPNWGGVTSFSQAWYGCTSLTSFPLIDTSKGTSFPQAWRVCSSITSFPLIDTHAGTNFNYAWYGCSSLTSFPLIDTSAGTNFSYAWSGCSSITSFPLLDTSAGTSFYIAWSGCSSLTSFPASFFDAWTATPAADCFSGAWSGCTALNQGSLNNIVASLVVANKAAPAIGKNIHLDGDPTLATMQGDATFMGHITTLKGLNWIPRYKGTAL